MNHPASRQDRHQTDRGTAGLGRLSVLVADDDAAIRKLLQRLLEDEGFVVTLCSDGSQALTTFEGDAPDFVILDVKMPQVDGLTVCRELRVESDVPIIVLTGIDDEASAAAALEAGADDYVRKPFGTSELLARMRAVLRRQRPESVADTGVLSAGSVTVDVNQRIVQELGIEVPLTKTEFELLVYLLKNVNRVLTHDQILERVWGADYIGAHHVLRVCVSRLRRKFRSANALALEALSGVGYRLRRSSDAIT